MNRKLHLILLVVVGLALSACSGKKDQVVRDDTGTETTTPVASNDMYGTGMSQAELSALGIMGNPLDYKTLYFEYNSSAIDTRSEVIARAHARELARRGGGRVTLEGHCDERGTRDYNLALGERRSKAVESLMAATGVGGSTINSISYGEERPVDTGHSESAWQKNRRVEISY
ncbi:MAG: OmpA family protein [Gammaproteobacteria bacterium]|nr:OmpA family protein [Gammaproteobacteria bacterium]